MSTFHEAAQAIRETTKQASEWHAKLIALARAVRQDAEEQRIRLPNVERLMRDWEEVSP